MSVIVSPSLLAADFMNLGKDVEMVDRSKADWIHLDIMDGIRAQYILWFTCCISNQENSP
jgi:pentose-5-phosphate-3-epimerase